MKIATFDVGGTAIKYCVMDGDKMTHRGKTPTKSSTQEEFLGVLDSILRDMGEVDGVAFSLPGTIDVDTRYIKTGGALPCNYDVDAGEWEYHFGMPVELENDARCSVIAEYEAGNLQGVKQGMVLAFGTGIGGGIVINGEVYKGRNLYAGEVSMIDFEAPVPERGDQGTFFTDECSTIGLTQAVARSLGLEEVSGEEAMRLIQAGDKRACEVFDRFLAILSREIHNIQCLIDPERICLGGGISQNPFFVDSVRKAVESFNSRLAFAFPNPDIVACKYFNDANLIGAYGHYLRQRRKRGQSL